MAAFYFLIVSSGCALAQSDSGCPLQSRPAGCRVPGYKNEEVGPPLDKRVENATCPAGLKPVDGYCEGSPYKLVGAGDPTVIGYFTPTFDNARTDFRVTWVCPKGAENWLVNVTVTMGFSHVDQLPAVRCDARHATLSAKLPSNLDGDPNVYAVVEAQANVCQTRQLLIDAKMAIPGSYSTRLSGTQARKDERVVVIHFKETGLWGVNTSDWEKGENSDLPTLVTENDRNSRRMAIPASSFSGRCPTAINVWHGNDGKGKSIWIADLVH